MHSSSETDTVRMAENLANRLEGEEIICLHGDLGAGKTTFARALIRALAGNPELEVPSPTFTLVQNYPSGRIPTWHFDLYRLKDPEEIHELGWEEVLGQGVVIVEWPERLGAYLPARRMDITLSSVENKPDSREIRISESS